MDWIQLISLAIIQGLTEFLPISSSAHLILVPKLLGWQDQGLLFDVSVHVGTLLAVLAYFRGDLWTIARAWWHSITGVGKSEESQLAWAVIWATVPAALVGVLTEDWIESHLRSALVIAASTGLFALALAWADSGVRGSRSELGLRWRDILIIGSAQALALIPGTSRSGITITAGLMMGMSRSAASRFSFLLSIPLIAAAGSLKAFKLATEPAQIEMSLLLIAILISAATAFACITTFLHFIERVGMWPFVFYRLALAGLLLVLFWP
jgi:undecaprenyl-diphosphatase